MDLWFWVVLGLAALVVMWVAGMKLNKSSRVPRTILFESVMSARSAVDSKAARLGLAGSDWVEKDGGAITRVLYPQSRGRDPYQLVVTVSADGRATLQHAPEGVSQELLLGFIPVAPAVPHGANVFTALVKKLEAAATSPMESGSAPRPPGSPHRPVSPGTTWQNSLGSLERIVYFKFHAIFFFGGIAALFAGRDGGERIAGLVVAAIAGFLAYRKWIQMEAEAELREARARDCAENQE